MIAATVTPTVDAACLATGASCGSGADCCEGTCDTDAYVDTWRTCLAPLPRGAYCAQDRACASHSCQSYACVGGACDEVGVACNVDADCCAGSFCDNETYNPWTCTRALPNGAGCSKGKQCQSGTCTSYVCAAAP